MEEEGNGGADTRCDDPDTGRCGGCRSLMRGEKADAEQSPSRPLPRNRFLLMSCSPCSLSNVNPFLFHTVLNLEENAVDDDKKRTFKKREKYLRRSTTAALVTVRGMNIKNFLVILLLLTFQRKVAENTSKRERDF